MSSKKSLRKLLDSQSIISESICKIRNNQFKDSFFNELICSNITTSNLKLQKYGLPFKHIKQYIEVCFVEHFIIINRKNESLTNEEDISNNLKAYQPILDNLLNSFDCWIDKVEKLFREKPFACQNCGLRFTVNKIEFHQCRVLNLMSHSCVCGEVFDDHFEFSNHIQPVRTNYLSCNRTTTLPFPKCKLCTLHYIVVWLKMAKSNFVTDNNCPVKMNKKNRNPDDDDFDFYYFYCDVCKNNYTNFVSWIIDYCQCIERDFLTCQICADYIGGMQEDLFSKLKSVLIPITQFDNNQVNLKNISQYFINSKLNKSTNINEIMSAIGFDNIFHFELNKLLKNFGNVEELRTQELTFYKNRNIQLLTFLVEFPNICEKCFSRYNSFNIIKTVGKVKKRLLSSVASIPKCKRHHCRSLKQEEHVCVCTARFLNHESYVYHRLYRCQFLLYFHMCLLMISNRLTKIHSMCNKLCVPIHDISELRDHWKACKECHMVWIENCLFCSNSYRNKLINSSESCYSYFKRLLQARDFVTASETHVENSLEKKWNVFGYSSNPKSSINYYETKLYCLKSGPPFSLVGMECKVTIDTPNDTTKRFKQITSSNDDYNDSDVEIS